MDRAFFIAVLSPLQIFFDELLRRMYGTTQSYRNGVAWQYRICRLDLAPSSTPEVLQPARSARALRSRSLRRHRALVRLGHRVSFLRLGQLVPAAGFDARRDQA